MDAVYSDAVYDSSEIVLRFLSGASGGGESGYNPRSGRHVRVGCYAAVFDVFCASRVLQAEARSSHLGYTLNVALKDQGLGYVRKVSLGLARGPRKRSGRRSGRNLLELAEAWKIRLRRADVEAWRGLPALFEVEPEEMRFAVSCCASNSRATSRSFETADIYRRVIRSSAPSSVVASLFLFPDGRMTDSRDLSKLLDGATRLATQRGDDLRPCDAVGAIVAYTDNDALSAIVNPDGGRLDLSYRCMIRKAVRALEP